MSKATAVVAVAAVTSFFGLAAGAATAMTAHTDAVEVGFRQQPAIERISSYDVDIRIETTGDIHVTEVIDYDFATAQRHGIFREIPVRLHYDDRYDRIFPLDQISIHGSAGTPDTYKTENVGSRKRFKIGDPDKTISGAHRYTVAYRVRGALNHFRDHDELYWNAIGVEWPVSVGRATVRVTAPAAVTAVACFRGEFRSSLPCDSATHTDRVSQMSQGALGPYQGLAVVVGFPLGAVPAPRPVLDERWTIARAFEATPATLAGGAGILIAVVALLGGLMWRTGRDDRWVGSPVDVAFGNAQGVEEKVGLFEHPVTPVEYEPPDGLLPGQIGTLIDEAANPLDVTATIIHLAVRGCIVITEIPKHGWFGKPDWRLTKVKEPSDLRPYEQLLMKSLFRDGDEVKLSDLRTTFAARLKAVQDALYDDVVAQGWFARRPDRTRSFWSGVGVGAVVAGLGAVTHLGLVALPLVVGGLMLLIGAKRMPRRTSKGTGVLRRVQGFRRLMEESEKERARFAERQSVFSEYLPYAVVFGCTEKWARAFAGLADQMPETSWYVGAQPFTFMTFSHSIDGFAVNTAGTITTTPAGSGSSGLSGGGGFSGGGGGGGGGGSW